jgi:phosphate transport system protein
MAVAGGLTQLVGLAGSMLREVIAAYEARDTARAMAVRDRDATLDAAYTSVFRELLTYMMEDPRNITPCTHLLFIAKNLERIGDHATNIAENIWFVIHGEPPAEARAKADTTSSLAE